MYSEWWCKILQPVFSLLMIHQEFVLMVFPWVEENMNGLGFRILATRSKECRWQCWGGGELIWVLLDYSTTTSTFFEKYKPIFLELYVKLVLNAREKPSNALCDAFHPPFIRMVYVGFKIVMVPASVNLSKCNLEIVMESVGVLLKSITLDLSNYAVVFLSVVLPQARHADEGQRIRALAIVGCLAKMSKWSRYGSSNVQCYKSYHWRQMLLGIQLWKKANTIKAIIGAKCF